MKSNVFSYVDLKPKSRKLIPDKLTCSDLFKWTDWKSAFEAKNGHDFEILADHVKFFG